MKSAPLCIYNTLSRRKEPFSPVGSGRATIYTCGPTVYRHAHIGNLRSYLMADWLRRFLEAQGHSVMHVKNITDVGHMRQDVLERGEDKVIAAALQEGKSPQEIAEFYTNAFLSDEAKLNILPAHEFPRATDNVVQMVELIKDLVEKGFAYVVEGNVYFEVGRFAAYGKLSGQQAAGLEEGARVDLDPLKRDQRDFALWKAAEPGRLLKWPSPWGEGFPGWHIECSAMVSRYLGSEIDFHTGGVDNIFPHHEDEIAQSEASLGREHVRTWIHGQHLLVDGLKMAKSTGNTYLIEDLQSRGFDPMAFRYLCATAHFRSRLNFTLPSLRAAARALSRLRQQVRQADRNTAEAGSAEAERFRESFWAAAADGLNIPAALAAAWKVARSKLSGDLKRELLTDFDRLLGLNLIQADSLPQPSEEAGHLAAERDVLRDQERYRESDPLRARIRALGYEIQDGRVGSRLYPLPLWALEADRISSSQDVVSRLEKPAELDWTVSIVARQGCREVERCLASVRASLRSARAEIIIVDNGFDDDCGSRLDGIAGDDERLRVFHADHFLGSAAARNVSLKQARGSHVLFIDTSVELTADIFASLTHLLADSTVGVAGRWGVVTDDIRSFVEAKNGGDVHAVEGYLMAFRREVLREVGFLDEKYRFYRHLDLDFSFALRSKGYRAVIDADLPVVGHEHIDWSLTPEDERERLSKRNFYRFLHKWGERNRPAGDPQLASGA